MDYSNTGSMSTFNQFSTTNNYTNATKEFFESNSLVAKVAFLLLILIVFVILLRVGISTLGYFLSPSKSPLLINGTVDAKQVIVIPQDPTVDGSVTISRSVNANEGIEFTWSIWIFIDDLTYKSGKYKCVFYKGNDFATNTDPALTSQPQGLNFPNNAPGLYIEPNTNSLVVFMNTFNVINEQITIDDIPLNKWVNVIIRCQNNILDIYINGVIAKSHNLHGVPKQNYGDIFVAPNGGFSGYISNLAYYNYAMTPSSINKLVTAGPSNTLSGNSSLTIKNPNYLSLNWFFNGN